MGEGSWEGRKSARTKEVVGLRKTYFVGKEGRTKFRACTGQCGFSWATAGIP